MRMVVEGREGRDGDGRQAKESSEDLNHRKTKNRIWCLLVH